MKTELTPKQRASKHISTTCPACGHEILIGTSRYDGIHIGSHQVCPWCETMLVVAAMTVACVVEALRASEGNEIQAHTTESAEVVEGARAAIAGAYSPADHGGVST